MLSADYINGIAEEAAANTRLLYDDIINRIVERITVRLHGGAKYVLTGTDKWQIETLREAGFLIADIQKDIAKRTGLTFSAVKAAFLKAHVQSWKNDSETYKAAGLSNNTTEMAPQYIRILERGYAVTAKELYNLTRTTAYAAQKTFITACDEAYMKVMTGALSYADALKDAIMGVTGAGLTIEYPTGAKASVETATLRCIRTGVSQTASFVTAERAADNGVECFLTSQHFGARPTHVPWQGRVFWVDWAKMKAATGISPENTPTVSDEIKARYPEFVESTDIGSVTGLCGANCRHSYAPFFPDVSENPFKQMTAEEQKKSDARYIAEQRARVLENRIRHTKRAIRSLKTAVSGASTEEAKNALNETLNAKKTLLERQISAYYDFINSNGIKLQEFRLSVSE